MPPRPAESPGTVVSVAKPAPPVTAVTSSRSPGMRLLTLLLAFSPAAAWAGSLDLSASLGASWPRSDLCLDYRCPVAPQLAGRVGYSPSWFGESRPLSLGVRGELNAGPAGGGRSRDPSNNSRALLVEGLAHTPGRWQLTGSLAAGVGSIVSLHGERDIEIGASYGDVLLVVEASLGLRLETEHFQLGVEGRYTDWPAALRDSDTFAGFRPPHREPTSSLSAAVVIGAFF